MKTVKIPVMLCTEYDEIKYPDYDPAGDFAEMIHDANSCIVGGWLIEPAQQWIKCSERLPNCGETVVVSKKGSMPFVAELDTFEDFDGFRTDCQPGWFDRDGYLLADVDEHDVWMPLPQPPEDQA